MTRLSTFTAPAKREQRHLDSLRTQLDSATADAHLTRDERVSLRKLIDTASKGARPMVAYQSEPVQKLLGDLKRSLTKGKLAAESDGFESRLDRAGDRLVAQGTFAAKHDRLDKKGWKGRFPGVATRDFKFNGLKVNAVAIDLADPRVRLQTNSKGERGRTVDGQAQAHHAEVAINGDFFSLTTHLPSGLAKTEGKRWNNSTGFEPSIAFTGRHAAVLDAGHHGEPGWASNVVSGRPQVLKDGNVVTNPPDMNDRTSRTGAGLSKSGRVMYLVAVEGKSGVNGLTGTELGQLLKRLGAENGMTFDGGGSAQMYQRGRGLVHPSTDPGGRRGVSNVLMVQSHR